MIDLPLDLPPQYRYAYKAVNRGNTWQHTYELIGEKGGIHLSVNGPHYYSSRDNWSAGIETHHRAPPPHLAGTAPSFDECFLLKCPCWHEGSSLYAKEVYLPLVLDGLHAVVFRAMAKQADKEWSRVCE